jgi:hypothetical protein
MTLTNDPLKPQLSNWRLKQNIVLLIYLNVVWNTESKDRASLPYSLVKRDGMGQLLDADGRIACTFEAVGSTFLVKWYRSWFDYEEMDRVGQLHTPRVEVFSGRT